MTSHLTRIAAAGALCGALGFAAFGLGAGTASADNGNIPFVPGGNASDWESYLPMVERLGDIVPSIARLGNLGTNGTGANTGSTSGLGSLGSLGGLGSLPDLLGILGR